MTTLARTFSLTATAVAASLLIAACGGGDPTSPPDTVAPTVAITDNVPGATAAGAVTFTFTFSEDVGTSFTAEDVVVTGGTAGAFTKVDATHYTLVVTPTANSTGTIAVSVAAAKFSDLALNANTAAASADQAFDTIVAAESGNTGTCTTATCIGFEGATVAFEAFEGLGSAAVVADPADATNKVAKLVKVPAGQPWAGATVYTEAATKTVGAINFATSKIVTLRVYSPAAGRKIRLKVEDGADTTVYIETDAMTTKGGAWETLSFDFGAPATTPYNPAKTYNKVSIFPDFLVAATADDTYYFDELNFPAAAAGGGGGTLTCTAPECVDFSAAGIGFGPFENGGGGTVEIAAGPVDAANKAVKFVKKAGDGDYFGTTITGLGVKPVLTAGAKTVTMRVFSPAAGTNFLLKFEGGVGGPAATEKDVATTQAGTWETLTFEMPDIGTYSTVVVFPHGRSAVSADTVMYIDDLKFPATAPVDGGGSGGFVGGVFADDYVGDLFVNSKSTQGGDVGFFFDQRLVDTKAYDYAGVAGTAQDPAGVHNFYFGFGLNPPAITDAYFGAYVGAPGNAPVDVSGYTNIKVNVWGPDQLFKAGTFPALTVVLQGPAVAGCQSSSGASEVERTFNTTTQGAASVYNLPLSSFTLKAACSGETTVAQVLAAIKQFNILLLNTNIQYVNKDPNNVAFTNGLNIGSIKFD